MALAKVFGASNLFLLHFSEGVAVSANNCVNANSCVIIANNKCWFDFTRCQ